MTSNQRITAGILVAALFLAGCGEGDKSPGGGAAPATTSAPAQIQAMLPEGTLGILYVPSLAALEADIQRVAASVEPAKADDARITPFVGMLGLDPADLDASRAAAFALTLGADQQPSVTALLPVKDEKAAAAKLRAHDPGAVVADGVAVVNLSGNYKRAATPPSLAKALPQADVVLRLDMAALSKTLGPMAFETARQSVAEFGDMAAPGSMAGVVGMIDGLKTLVEASSTWDLAIRIDGTAVEIELVMGFTDPAKAPVNVFSKSDLQALARGLPDGDGIMMAAALDGTKISSAVKMWTDSALESLPPEQREQLRSVDEAMKALARIPSTGMAVTGGLGPGGMAFVGMIDTPDPQGYVRAMGEAVAATKSMPGLEAGSPEEKTIEGVKVTTFGISIDAKQLAQDSPDAEETAAMVSALLGGDRLNYAGVPLDKRLLLVTGRDDLVPAAIKAAKAGGQNALSRALAESGPDTVGFMRFDYRELMRDLAPAIAKSTPGLFKTTVPEGDPVPLTLILNRSDGGLRSRLQLDVGKLASLFKSMSPK